MKLGRIESEVVGLIQHDMKKHDVRISGFLMLNFPFSEKAMESMAEDLGAIEAKMREIIDLDQVFTKEVWDRAEAVRTFREMGENYKAEILSLIHI